MKKLFSLLWLCIPVSLYLFGQTPIADTVIVFQRFSPTSKFIFEFKDGSKITLTRDQLIDRLKNGIVVTHGANSPAVAGSGNVVIHYGEQK